MADKLFKTKGIVLRTVKYGETSLIVSLFTELFGIQSYLVNGVRTTTKRGSGRANLFMPAALLDLVVYHRQGQSLQRIKEFHWDRQYEGVFGDITKNAIALYMVELLTKCLREPEENSPLFQFTEDCLLALDRAPAAVQANMPLFFALHLTYFFGVQPRLSYNGEGDDEAHFFDLIDSVITDREPVHHQYVSGRPVAVITELLQVRQPEELAHTALSGETRRQLLQLLERYYALHIQDFGTLRTLPVLREILS